MTKIGKEAFFTCNLEELVIGNSVQTIGNDAFTNIKHNSNVYYCGIQSLNSSHFLPSQSSLRIHVLHINMKYLRNIINLKKNQIRNVKKHFPNVHTM